MEDIIRQAFALGITRRTAARPAAIKAAMCCDPYRSKVIFYNIGNESPLSVLTDHSYVNWNECERPPARVQTVKPLQRPAPERAVVTFEQDGDGPRVPICVFGYDHGEHWRRCLRCFVRIDDATRRRALRVESHQPGISRHPIFARPRL